MDVAVSDVILLWFQEGAAAAVGGGGHGGEQRARRVPAAHERDGTRLLLLVAVEKSLCSLETLAKQAETRLKGGSPSQVF